MSLNLYALGVLFFAFTQVGESWRMHAPNTLALSTSIEGSGQPPLPEAQQVALGRVPYHVLVKAKYLANSWFGQKLFSGIGVDSMGVCKTKLEAGAASVQKCADTVASAQRRGKCTEVFYYASFAGNSSHTAHSSCYCLLQGQECSAKPEGEGYSSSIYGLLPDLPWPENAEDKQMAEAAFQEMLKAPVEKRKITLRKQQLKYHPDKGGSKEVFQFMENIKDWYLNEGPIEN